MKMETGDAFQPRVWPEQEAPADYGQCMRCELSKQRRRVIWGEGNPAARLVVLLDNPGEREDAAGAPYVCGTRQTLQRAAQEAGLAESDLYVTYVLKCRPLRTYDKPACRAACRPHLDSQLREMDPLLLFCMGNVAVQSFWQDPDIEVKTLRGSIHEVGGYRCAVTYHPLAVRRRPNLYRLFREDWDFVAEKYRALMKQ